MPEILLVQVIYWWSVLCFFYNNFSVWGGLFSYVCLLSMGRLSPDSLFLTHFYSASRVLLVFGMSMRVWLSPMLFLSSWDWLAMFLWLTWLLTFWLNVSHNFRFLCVLFGVFVPLICKFHTVCRCFSVLTWWGFLPLHWWLMWYQRYLITLTFTKISET